MFKKSLLLLIVFSPLIYALLVGFPVVSEQEHTLKQSERPNFLISKRCFAVGDFKELLNCFSNEKISGLPLVNEVVDKTTRVSVLFTGLLIISFCGFIFFGISVLF